MDQQPLCGDDTWAVDRLESVASADMYKGAPCKVICNLENICMLIEERIVWLGNSLDGIN